MKTKRVIAIVLSLLMVLQVVGLFSTTASSASASSVLTNVINKEGVWLTEIYQNDVDRSVANNTRESKGQQSIQLYTSATDLMEYIEISSTHSSTIKLNDMYKFYYETSQLTVTTMSGSSDISIEKGQAVVLWNYRSDITTGIPTEAEFRKEMRIPDSALVLKATCGAVNWTGTSSFSIERKSDGVVVSEFAVTKGVENEDGLCVDLKIPHIGYTMDVYRKMNIPSAGRVDSAQLNWLVDVLYPADTTPSGVFVTEIMANDIDRSGTYGTTSDVMECFEIYNGTSSTIDLNTDIDIMYVLREGARKKLDIHKHKGANDDAMGSNASCTLAAGETAVLWCNRKGTLTDYSSYPTLKEFRAAYGIATEATVYVFNNQDVLANEKRGIEIYVNNSDGSKELTSSYFYLGDGSDFDNGTSALLQVRSERPEMWVHTANAEPTLSTVKPAQYTYKDDNSRVTIALDDQLPEKLMQGEELRIRFRYEEIGALSRKNITLYYRMDGKGSWNTFVEKKRITPNVYDVNISADQLFDHDYVEFYICANNKFRSVLSDVYRIDITKLDAIDGIRTNISEGEEVKGTISVTANDGGTNANSKIYIDGTKRATTPMMEDGAYLTFTLGERDHQYHAALTTYGDNQLIADLSRWRYTTLDGQAVHIDNSYFTYDSSAAAYTIRVRFWAGTMGAAADDTLLPDSNRDEITVTHLAMKLPNGNTYYPTKIGPSNADTDATLNTSTDYSAVHSLGDKSGMRKYMNVTFSIPATEVNAVGTEIDTTTLSDGAHVIKVTNGTSTQKVNFIVDNTAPAIKMGITDGSTLTGNITINPQVTDANTLSGKTVLLDDDEITTPYTTTGYQLKEGTHTLAVTAEDKAGNTKEKSITFTVADVDVPLKSAGAKNITDRTADLYFTLDNTASDTQATFYAAEQIETTKIKTNTGSGILPYIQYTVDVGEVSDDDIIFANWDGSASNANDTHINRMYVKNTSTGKWDSVANADSSGSISNAKFVAKNHVKSDGTAIIIVQCTTDTALPDLDTATNGGNDSNASWDGTTVPKDYDFCFAWETDTQYYAEEYQFHYLNMNQWIVDNAEKMKIKYVMHTGDIVDDSNMIYQWENASAAMKILDDAGIPNGVLGGNHDVSSVIGEYDNYKTYFGRNRYNIHDYYGTSYKNNLGHYDLISEDGQDFLILYMSWNIYDEEITWMNKILKKYSDRKAIICLHPYTKANYNSSGTLSDYFTDLLQSRVVAKNPNVFAVLNGHYHGSSYQVSKFDDDGDGTKERTVYQICTDYQSGEEGGMEYIKFLYFDLDNNKIYMNSYSPYLNDYNFFDGTPHTLSGDGSMAVNIDPMILKVDFDTKEQNILENSFSAYLCKNKEIGTAKVDASTNTATVSVDGLSPETEYVWFAEITNANTGLLETSLYEFTTAERVFVLGDTNNNGRVDIGDVTYIQMAVAEMITPTTEEIRAGNVDGDGKLTIRDATTIQLYLAKIIDKLPAG